jgi:AcrR family transcriptional regulator
MIENLAPAPSKREIASEKRRNHILESAIACFIDKGFHQTGMRDIAARAEVSIGNLYNHFPSKHDFLIGLANMEGEMIAPFIEHLAVEGPANETFNAFLQDYWAIVSDKDVAILTAEITAEAMRMPDIAKLFLEVRRSLAHALSALLEKGLTQGIWRPSGDPLHTANFILDTIECAADRQAIDTTESQTQLAYLEKFLIASLGAENTVHER